MGGNGINGAWDKGPISFLSLPLTVAFVVQFLLYPKAFAAPTTSSFNIKQAIEHALLHSPTLNSAQREARVSEMERKNAHAGFLPSLDLTARHGIQDSSPRMKDTPWASDFSLGITENLYDNGESFTKYRISQLKKEQTDISYIKERDRLCLDVGNEFFRYSLAVRVSEIVEGQSQLVKKQFDMVKTEYRQGLKTRKDFLRFKTQLNRTEIDLVNARLEALKSKQELIRLLALPLDSSEEVEFVPDQSEKVADKIPEKAPAIEQHFEFRVARLQEQINGLESDLVKRKYWPQVNLSSAVNYQSEGYMGPDSTFFERDQLSWNALITVSYNFWDWGIRARNVDIAIQRRAIQKNEQDNKLLTVKTEISRLMYDLERLRENFRLSVELLALEKDNYNLLETEYRYGKVQYLDLITGLKDLADAKSKYFSALSELKQGLFNYRYHQGTLYETIVSNAGQ